MTRSPDTRLHTLLVGGDARPSADHITLDDLGTSAVDPHLEVLLQVPIETLSDPWSTVRHLWELVSHEGVVTIRAGAAVAPATGKSLLRLGGFDPIDCRQRPAGRVWRGRRRARREANLSCTVVVPCKDEVENVGPLVARLPELGTHTELLFVDGWSTDGTPERVRSLIAAHPERDIKLLEQHGNGKAGAVFHGFDHAEGEVLIILDADMTVAPEDLRRFYLAVAEEVLEFANGTRFAFPMESGAMHRSNWWGNRAFAKLFSRALGTSITDSLCGTKALRRSDWHRIAAVRPALGGYDLWGDFDLLWGAGAVGLRIGEVPVRYYARQAGESKMRPFRHGLLLARACAAGVRLLKSGSPAGAPDR